MIYFYNNERKINVNEKYYLELAKDQTSTILEFGNASLKQGQKIIEDDFNGL